MGRQLCAPTKGEGACQSCGFLWCHKSLVEVPIGVDVTLVGALDACLMIVTAVDPGYGCENASGSSDPPWRILCGEDNHERPWGRDLSEITSITQAGIRDSSRLPVPSLSILNHLSEEPRARLRRHTRYDDHLEFRFPLGPDCDACKWHPSWASSLPTSSYYYSYYCYYFYNNYCWEL
jgi:hypothetical protein